MKTEVVWVSFVAVTAGVIILALIFYNIRVLGSDFNPTGIWANENLKLRMLLHNSDEEYQGSVIWANGIDRFLGMRIIENVRFDNKKVGKGKYFDPFTGNQYEIKINFNRKGLILIDAYHPINGDPVFSQEWKQVPS